MNQREAQELVTAAAAKIERHIETRKVAGSGGRLRTVAICESGCWHGNRGQAMKCKNAQWVAVQATHGNLPRAELIALLVEAAD